jgi:tetratricopeptide (TPR) repeat protein
MTGRWTAAVIALSVCAYAGPVLAQADVHAEALTRASCQAGKQSEAVKSATATLDRDPDELGARLRLADTLVDQGCYQEAVAILEAGQEGHPRNSELAGKLRDVRSLVTEQTYIEGLTQAAEGAKFQRNQLRCTRLADITACDDALKFKPDDAQLLIAKGDALMQATRAGDAVAAYRHASQLRPGDELVKSKLTAAETLQATTAAAGTVAPPTAVAQAPVASTSAGANSPSGANASGGANGTTGASTAGTNTSTAANTATRPKASQRAAANSASTRAAKPVEAPPPVASVAALEPQSTRTYSNDAPAGQTN